MNPFSACWRASVPGKTTRLLILSFVAGTGLAAPSEYEVTDITGWNAAQLATLPYFDRYIPIAPSGAGNDFVPVAQNGQGVTIGNRDFSTTWVQGSGAYVQTNQQTNISAWLRPGNSWSYSWSYSYFDGEDVHFQNGFVTHSPVRDINVFGKIIGYATRAGAGSGYQSSSAYSDHAWLRDTRTGQHLDLTPTAKRADPRSINDYGEITGTWSDEDALHPFRRLADGQFFDFSVTNGNITPQLINNHGLIAGMVTIWSTPRDYYPFVSRSGSEMIRLPLPSQESPDTANLVDINDHHVIVGNAYRSTQAYEHSAVRWIPDGASWEAEDLNELLADHEPEVLLDRCIAVNDAGYIIAAGHLDGTDTENTRRFLLSPDQFEAPTITTLPITGMTSTGAIFAAKVNACDRSTNWQIDYGTSTAYGSVAVAASANGTHPQLSETTMSGLQPHTEYHVRATGTNNRGTTNGKDLIFETAWDFPSWSGAMLGGATTPTGDLNSNGLPDLLDYATGNAANPIAIKSIAGEIRVEVMHALGADGVELRVEVSNDLIQWNPAGSYSLLGSEPVPSLLEEMHRETVSASQEKITLRPVGNTTAMYVRLAAEM